MRLPTLFKQHKNKRFNFPARHYNEQKERLDKLYEKHHGTPKDSQKNDGFKKRTSFREDWKGTKKDTDQKQSQIRLLVIFALLLAGAVLILNHYNISLF